MTISRSAYFIVPFIIISMNADGKDSPKKTMFGFTGCFLFMQLAA